AERLRKKVSEIIVKSKYDNTISPTISIGIASFPTDGQDCGELIKSADEALYFAKKIGKNCVAEYGKDGCLLVQSEN
ncbi:MAG: diguanylate cyclase, partial [Candidatus Gastranaerophilales bacterium]|nr:diguanylate cyclase [Candidatus Gastranaerophilales bacterium]